MTLRRSTPLRRTAFKASDPAAKRMVRRAMSQTPKGTRSRWMRKADTAFSQFVRLRDADEHGIVRCITCGKRKHWKEVDCGHYVSRAKQVLRYDERNCNAQCKGCNQWQGGHFVEHGFAIDRKHGDGTYRLLLGKANIACHRKAVDFQFIATTYAERVAWITQHEPGKFDPFAASDNDPVQLLST